MITVFFFFSALPEMQSHRQLTHLGMGVRGAVCTRELLQEERERVKAASEGGRDGGSGGMSKCFDTQQEVTQS